MFICGTRQVVRTIGPKKEKLLAARDTQGERNGTYNFVKMRELIGLFPAQLQSLGLKYVDEVEHYLKNGYRDHLSTTSTCSCGNYGYLFGDGESHSFSACSSCQKIHYARIG